jgi:putative endonuclease
MEYCVYIIQSKVDGTYYVGQTEDVRRRLQWHNEGKSKYTKPKIPWEVMYVEEFNTRREAIRRERKIKRKKSRKYIEWLINRGVAQFG